MSPCDNHRNAKRTAENTATADVKLTDEEAKEIWDVVNSHEVKGGRYVDEVPASALHLWG